METKIKKHVPVGISLPKEMYEQIDNIRGDISRSRFIQRVLEKVLASKSKK
jgi:metal-responsive CopG/Arc/MetJ family transcriptional regulator